MVKNKTFIIFFYSNIIVASTMFDNPEVFRKNKYEYEKNNRYEENKDTTETSRKSSRSTFTTSEPSEEIKRVLAHQELIEEPQNLEAQNFKTPISEHALLEREYIKPKETGDIILKEDFVTIPISSAQEPNFHESIDFLEKENFNTKKDKDIIDIDSLTPNVQMSSTSSNFLTNQQEISSNSTKDPYRIVKTIKKHLNRLTVLMLEYKFHVALNEHEINHDVLYTITQAIKNGILDLLHIPQITSTQNSLTSSLNKLKFSIQKLAEQIEFYNNKQIYNKPEQMLELIKTINKFLKEVDTNRLSVSMISNLNSAYKQAENCYNLFVHQNFILSTKSAPEQVLLFFQKPMQNIENLTDLQFSYNLLETIYQPYGHMDQLLQTWKNFERSPLYKNKANRPYGAFITFLLIFENSIIAAANFLDETSQLYQVTNPIAVVINNPIYSY